MALKTRIWIRHAEIVLCWEDGTVENPQFRQPLADEIFDALQLASLHEQQHGLNTGSTTMTIAPAKAKGDNPANGGDIQDGATQLFHRIRRLFSTSTLALQTACFRERW